MSLFPLILPSSFRLPHFLFPLPIRVIRVIRGLIFLLLLALPRVGSALTPPQAPAPGPDVIIGDLPTLVQAGSNGTQVGLMMATDICNNGNVQVNWFQFPETDHPVIPQNLYRLSGGANNDDRFEQVGQSWVKHALIPLQQNTCGGCIASPDSAHLGVGCSTADSASANASQSGLGSRAWVNPFTGIFPSTANSHTGHTHDGTAHRILVEANDLNTAMNPGATYFGEAQLIAPHESAWCVAHPGECNMFNNVSYRQFTVAGTTSFSFSPTGGTVRETPAIFAWPGATVLTVEPAPGVDGKVFVAYKVTGAAGLPGIWYYEYAIYNENLDRGIQSFSVPGGCGFGTPTNLEFHAPLNPPGTANDGTVGDAGYSNAPWTPSTGPDLASWSTETFAQNPNANALRWGTLYNFRFRAGTPPTTVNATIGFFKTGAPIIVPVLGSASECQPSPSPSPSPAPTPSPTATPSSTPTPTPSPSPSAPPCDKTVENFDSVTAPALPPGWSSSFWVTSTTDPDSAPNDAFVSAPAFVSDRPLDTSLIVYSATATVAFQNRYSLDSGGGEFFDGGVLEISSPNINGGAFTDITNPAVGGSFVVGGYNATISSDFGNPLAGRRAWSSFSPGYITTRANLGPNLVGQTIILRFRLGTDLGGDANGKWRIDTISFSGVCMTFPPPPSPTATPSATPTPSPTSTPACAWTAAAVYPIPSVREAVTSMDGNIYSFGGRSNGNYVSASYKFDGTSWTSIAPLPVVQGGSMATNDGTFIYILGGVDNSERPFNTMYRYNPATNTYTTLSPFFTEVSDGVAVCLGGKIYKIFGDTVSASTNTIEIYNITTGTWTHGTGNPGDGRAGFASAFVQENYIYIAGGRFLGNTDATTKTYRYDTATDTWSDDAIADLPEPRWAAASAFYNEGGVLAGGYVAHGPFQQIPTASTVSWDPILNTWITLPDMPGERTLLSGAVLNGSFHVVGGGAFASQAVGTNDNQKLTCGPTPRPTATPTPTPSTPPTPTPSPPSYAVNLSTRMRVEIGDRVGIGGFIIAGAPKYVLMRAIGPSLFNSGVPNPLIDPVLELHGPDPFASITNNNWQDTQEQEIRNTGLPPTNNLESAIAIHLNPGTYTAIVRGNGNLTGIALVEIYDLDQGVNSRLANLSTRAFVGTDDSVVIAGFILGGGTHGDRIVVRGLGPSLAAGGVPNVLPDPGLQLRDSNGAILAGNDNWQDDPTAAAELIAAGLAPTNDLEAAIALTLQPGVYTALLVGNNGNGIGLVEVYDREPAD